MIPILTGIGKATGGLSLMSYLQQPINSYQHLPTSLNISQHLSTSLNICQHLPISLDISQHLSTSLNISQRLSTSLNVSQYLSTHLKTSIMSLNASGCHSILLATPPLLLFLPRAVQEMIQDLRVHLRGVKTRRRKLLTTVNKTETPPSIVTVRRQGISLERS